MQSNESEVCTQPSFVQGQSISSPYYNMDLVEFVMGLPLTKRFALDKNKLPAIDKLIIQKVASRYFPMDIVSRKKAFVVSFERDQTTKALYGNLPDRVLGIALDKPHESFGGEILMRWLKQQGFVAIE